jgi:hypothetical protein
MISQYRTREGSITTGILRRQKNFACVRIFYCGPRRKAGHIDVTVIWRERTGNQAWLTGDGSSIQQLSFLLARAGGCLRPPDIALTRRRRGWAARRLTIQSIARRSLIMLMTAPVPSRLWFRVGN